MHELRLARAGEVVKVPSKLTRRELTLVLESIYHDVGTRRDMARKEHRPKVADHQRMLADELAEAARKLEFVEVTP